MVGLLFISGAASLILAVLGFAFSLNGYIYIRVELFLLKIWIAVGFILRGSATAFWRLVTPSCRAGAGSSPSASSGSLRASSCWRHDTDRSGVAGIESVVSVCHNMSGNGVRWRD